MSSVLFEIIHRCDRTHEDEFTYSFAIYDGLDVLGFEGQ